MKNYIVIILFLGIWCVCCFSSCTKDPWVYDTSRKSGIYMLDTRDSNKVIFGIYTDTNWISGVVDLYTIGVPVDYDREVTFAPVDTATNIVNGKDFTLEKTIVKAGTTTATLRYWVRMPENKEDEEGKLYYTIRLTENEHFVPQICTTAFFRIYVQHQEQAPKWWNTEILGSYTEKGFKVYMKYHTLQETNKTENWQRYLGPIYGTNMYKVKSSTWNNEQMLFLDKLKEDVLVPMFDYFTANPYPGVEIPAWYEEWKDAEKN